MCSGTDNVLDAEIALLDAAAESPLTPPGYEPRRVVQPYAVESNAHMQTYTQMKTIRKRVPLKALFRDTRALVQFEACYLRGDSVRMNENG